MNAITLQKRNHLIAVAVVTLGLMAAIWFTLIQKQQRQLGLIERKLVETRKKLDQTRKTLASATQLKETLATASAELAAKEENMASGDYYSWIINQIRHFKLAYDVDIPQFGSIIGPANVTLLPGFPYKQVALTISGTGYYHDVGRFIADYENQFPCARIENLELEPAPVSASTIKEKLSFRMNVVVLVKPEAS
jgi:Tfp pilus assembly protein PilO